jgi:hypothetical protein
MKRELRRSTQEGDIASIEVQGGDVSDYADQGENGKRLARSDLVLKVHPTSWRKMMTTKMKMLLEMRTV